MRLVHAPDNSVDHHDRALWLTIPFDLEIVSLGTFALAGGEVYFNGVIAGGQYVDGTAQGQTYVNGVVAGELVP